MINEATLKEKAQHFHKLVSTSRMLLISIFFAGLTGLAAQIRIPLPFSPVPLSGQTFAVILSGIMLGEFAVCSQAIYVILGAVGIPWFAGFKGGLSVILGPTGGYLIGFIFASLFIGYFTKKYNRNFLKMLLVIAIANILIYLFGLAQLAYYMKFIKGSEVSLISVFFAGLIPFIPGDIIKIILAAGFSRFIRKA